MRVKLCILFGTLCLALIAAGHAVAEECNADSAWRRVRSAYPIHSQTLARCDNPTTGRVVIVLTEPPSHITPGKADSIVRALFGEPASLESVQRRRHPLGFDGWAEDLVIVVDARTPTVLANLDDNIALLATLAFGSAYKAEVENVDALSSSLGQAPPPLEITKEELFTWLIGRDAQKLISGPGATGATMQERADRNELGTYYSETPGLVVTLVPRGTDGRLNDCVQNLRRFAVDSDVFLGAIKLSNSRVALVGRERTTSLTDVPPLRVETLLLLASERSAQLSQSYERRRAFAGKLLTDAGDLFGWDWAPILLSNSIIDSEFGSLLNFTDNMLKSWSEGGTISYKGFPHKSPSNFPFGATGALRTMGTHRLTYNWNTAGVGLVSPINGTDIFAVRNTGSLPVSYFPEGSEDNVNAKSKLVEAEDQAYRYFRSLRNPLLSRAVQYAALYQAFLAFDVRASRPLGQAPAIASIENVERILSQNVILSLNQLLEGKTPINREFLLALYFDESSSKAQILSSSTLRPETQKKLDELGSEMAAKTAAFDKEQGQAWKAAFARLLAEGRPIPSIFKDPLEELAMIGIKMVRAPEVVRREVVRSSERAPTGWIRTPSIVVSQDGDETRRLTGGHNLAGRATRIELDATVPKGQVRASGSYENGRILRLNPADKEAERDVVRIFDREVGLRDENQSKGVSAVEAKLRDAPAAPRPVRLAANALEMPTTRIARGASPSAKAKQIGYRAENANLTSRPEIEALIRDTGADVIIAPAPPGYIVVRPRPIPPKTVTAPNPTSMHEAVDLVVRQVSLGPPLMAQPKIAFHSMERSDALRHVQSMVKRGDAVTDAGGKPPFGGDRNLYGLADAPEPERAFTYSLMDRNRPLPKHDQTTTEKLWDSILSVAGKRRQRIYSEAAKASVEYGAKPNWVEASLRFPRNEDTLLIGVPSNPGFMHTVEITVPVTISSKPQSIFVRAMSWFKDAPSVARTEAMESSITKIFKNSERIDVEEAFIRYKTLMIDRHGATNVQMNLSREGNDIIVVELSVCDAAKRG
jgi:hypothetical protein